MGVIRILLALAVVCAHTGFGTVWTGTGDVVAVQTFCMVSGFCIAMALSGRYRHAELGFWVNRVLRLYPVYLVVALVAVLAKAWTQPAFFAEFSGLPSTAQTLLILSNLLIVGQDWLMFVGVRDGALAYFTESTASTASLARFLMSPPAWPLATQLTVYACAPFLFRLRTVALLVVVAASLALRIALTRQGPVQDLWQAGYFPTMLGTFLVGALAYRATPWVRRQLGPLFDQFGPWATGLAILLIVGYGRVPGDDGMAKAMAFHLLFLVCLPFVFAWSRSSSIDRLIGHLSYPLFVSHWVTLEALAALLGAPQSLGAVGLRLLACVAVAVVLWLAIDAPTQRLRTVIRSAARTTGARIREPWPTTLR